MMELVYLWVEKYKNILNQGFNLSPRFECKYDENKKELTIDEKEEHINIFPENINVTAIVGDNGSGKSSIFKLIFLLFYCKNYNFEDNPIYHDSIIELVSPFVDTDLFLIVYINDKYKKISMSEFIYKLVNKYKESKDVIAGTKRDTKECSLVKYKEIRKDELKTFSIHFNYMLDTMYDSDEDKWIKDIYHKADSYKTPLLLEPYKNNNDQQLIDLDLIEYLNNQNLLRFYSKVNSNKKLFDFFIPNKIDLNYIVRNFDWTNLEDEDFTCLSRCKYFVAFKFFKLFEENNTFLSLRERKKEVCKICRKIDKLYNNRQYICINKLYIFLKTLGSNKNFFDKSEYKKISKWASEVETSKVFFELPSIDYKKLISKNAPNYEVRKIKNCISFEEKKVYNNDSFKKTMQYDNLMDIEPLKEILEFIPPWITVEFYQDNKSLKSLSSGEKSFFTLIINLFHQVKNINDRSEYQTINLFLDEIELGFHPQWQKNFINFLVYSLPLVNKKRINTYFATHSPFILSDLPKENVIFLEKDEKNGNCKNVTKDININTFGANIHTLLSHGFFMKEGLMGEFAKSKINEIIEFHNKTKAENTDLSELKKRYEEKKEQFWYIQKITGEDYLKQVIKNHLIEIEKIVLGNNAAKQEEIKRLKAQLEQLEK